MRSTPIADRPAGARTGSCRACGPAPNTASPKDLDFIGAYYHYIQNQYVANSTLCATPGGPAGNSRCAGWYDVYSVVIDWRFAAKWDAYIGTMYSAAFGGLANGDISRNNLATTAGVRLRF